MPSQDDLVVSVNAAIEQHLPSQVGSVLKKRLQDGEEAARQVAALTSQLQEANKVVRAAGNIEQSERRLRERELALAKEEDAVTTAKAVAAAVAEERVERIKDLKEVTLAVFSNARLKYTESGYTPVVIPGFTNSYGGSTQPSVSTGSFFRTVQGESTPTP